MITKIKKIMTEEQYKVLEKYDAQLNAALNSSFLRLSPNEFNEVVAVYDQLFTPLRKSQRACNTCRLNALKALGRAYNAEKERRAKEAAEKAVEKPTESNKEGKQGFLSSIIRKKPGRPKKIDLSE